MTGEETVHVSEHARATGRHELLLYDGEDQLARGLRAFAAGASAAATGRAIVTVHDQHEQLAVQVLAGSDGHGVATLELHAITPTRLTGACLLRRQRELTAGVAGPSPARLFVEPPHPGVGAYGDEWTRYEASLDHLLRLEPLRVVCAYDRRRTPAAHLAMLERCHPWWHRLGEPPAANPRHEPAEEFWRQLPAAGPDPVEADPPLVQLRDPTPREARHAVAAATRHLDRRSREDLVLAVSEAVTNASRHSQPPVEVVTWCTADRAIVAVRDHGTGPVGLDGFGGGTGVAALLPAPELEPRTSGHGSSIVHQLVHVTHARDGDGYTIRLATRPPGVSRDARSVGR